ncbi:hypothetical protein J6S37_01015 [Candidatus Saccharibacteria bacterium]|nr:hypothetical protein [Candidatus Saccharibacteria bacterium]
MRYEISQVCTFEEIIEKINDFESKPVGIVFFGTDCRFKENFLKRLQYQVDSVWNVYMKDENKETALHHLKRPFKSGQNVIVVMSGDISGDHDVRHQVVVNLLNNGAKSVVGVYVKGRKDAIRSLVPFLNKRFDEQSQRLAFDVPPTADGLDFLITVDED